MDNRNDITYCSRCGAEMRLDSRYCMKCGNLNYDHPDNADMKKFLGKNKTTNYEVGSGKFILQNNTSSQVTQSIANNTGSRILAFLVTYGLYLVIILISLFSALNSCNFEYIKIVSTTFPIIAIVVSIIFLFIYSIELMFMKANKRWWAGLIPLYNMMILSEMVFNKRKLGLITLIPVIGFIYTLVLFYKLGEKFKYNGTLTALLFVFMIPVIGFGSNPFDGRTFVDMDVKNASEREYKLKNIFLFTALLFLLSGVGMTVYSNLSDVQNSSEDFNNYYYVYSAKTIVKKIQKSSEKGTITCENGKDLNTNGVYYIYSIDASDEFKLPFKLLKDPIESYVKVVNSNGEIKYYISLTDGVKGFSEMLIDDVTTESIREYKLLSEVYEKGTNCEINW